MITIVMPSSRPGGKSAVIADEYYKALQELGAPAQILNLAEFTPAMIEATHYTFAPDRCGFDAIQQLVDASEKFVFILPEYNGSFPGLVKVFVDACRYPDTFTGKKVAMIGLSAGTQGAALAMSHFADILNYFGAHTLALRPRFIRINDAIQEGKLLNDEYRMFIQMQAEQLTKF